MAEQLGWLDTNLFIHALYAGDREYARSRLLLDALADGRAEGWLSPLVLHELSYALSRRPGYGTRAAIHTYLLAILGVPGIHVEDEATVRAALSRCASGALSLVDAYLGEFAQRDNMPVCSANARDFTGVSNSYAAAQV